MGRVNNKLNEWRDQWNNGDIKFVSELLDMVDELKSFVIECDADERAIQPYEILDRLN